MKEVLLITDFWLDLGSLWLILPPVSSPLPGAQAQQKHCSWLSYSNERGFTLDASFFSCRTSPCKSKHQLDSGCCLIFQSSLGIEVQVTSCFCLHHNRTWASWGEMGIFWEINILSHVRIRKLAARGASGWIERFQSTVCPNELGQSWKKKMHGMSLHFWGLGITWCAGRWCKHDEWQLICVWEISGSW